MTDTQNNTRHDPRPLVAIIAILIAVLAVMEIAGFFVGTDGLPVARQDPALEEQVISKAGVELGVVWGDLGKRLINAGVIDERAFTELYSARGGLSVEEKQLLSGEGNGTIVMTEENSSVVLNLLWAFGLANKNSILEKGEMSDPVYGGAGGFASTGGWTLAKGDAMDHYSRHSFIVLSPKQQALVERVSKGIFRPCCDNSTHFPDCNHGMAMLGLLELMASQGVSEEEMYKAALAVNSYWFPDTYTTIAAYMQRKGVEWKDVDPKEILGSSYSSASGYARIAAKVTLPQQQGGSGCGI